MDTFAKFASIFSDRLATLSLTCLVQGWVKTKKEGQRVPPLYDIK